MKYMNRTLLVIISIVFATSCSDDSTGPTEATITSPSFSISEGNIWYYDRYMVEDNETTTFSSVELHTLESTIIDGKECFKQVQVDAGESIEGKPFRYIRTDENGLYFYYNEFLEDYTSYFSELNNTWVQTVSFNDNNKQVLSLKKDTLDRLERPLSIDISYRLENFEDITVKYKGQNVTAVRTQQIIYIKMTTVIDGEEVENIDDRGSEIVVIPGIGIYKTRGIREGIFKDNYDILTDHK